MNRRGFLIAAAGTGVMFGFPLAAQGTEPRFEPTLWYHIDRDGIVTVNVTRAEMGQHVGAAIARIVAEELEADWSKVRVVHVDSDPKWGLMITGGSWSVWQSFAPMSRAGAAGRMALIAEGARLMGVDPATCTAANSSIRSGGKSLTYGEIVTRGDMSRRFSAAELAKMPIKAAKDRQLIGYDMLAGDIPAKTRGEARYGLDAQVPGMLYARPKLPPTRYDCTVVSVDDAAAKAVPGYVRSLVLDDPSGITPGWVMVLGDTWVAANRATDLVKVVWRTGEAAKVSEADIQARSQALIDDPATGSLLINDPGVDAAFAAAHLVVEQNYTTSTALHFQMEPVNVLAFEQDGIFEIHTGNQWQSLVLPWLAKALDYPQDKIVMRTYRLGGGFGRRLNGDYAIPAALAAKATGKPVKLVLSRADDSRFDSPRSPSVQRLRMALTKAGGVTAMQHEAAAGWPTQTMAAFIMGTGTNGVKYDPFSISGADHWYNVGAHRVRAVPNDLANRTFRPGWLRSVGPGWTNWALESFIDETAHALGVDPVTFRLSLLDGAGRNAGSGPSSVGGAHRQAAVLKQLVHLAGQGQIMPKHTGLGFATSFGQSRDMPTWVGCAAQVRVDPASGAVKVEKLTLVADAGTIIHPDGALAQMEGAALWGMSLALFEGTRFVDGQVEDMNLDTYTPLRMGDTPQVDIHFIASDQPPVGLGEPGVTVVGPAIANAIFNAVGARVRHLPIRSEAVLAAMPAKV